MATNTDPEVVEAATTVVIGSEESNVLTLQSGVALRLGPVSSGVLRRAAANVPEPEVPKVWLEDKERWEENPNDPSYLTARTERNEKQALAQINVAILYGTSIEKVPRGSYKPEDEEWTRPLFEDGFLTESDIDTPRKRYLNWVLLYALQGGDEAKLFGRIIALCGLTNAEVDEMMASFRGRGLRGADTV